MAKTFTDVITILRRIVGENDGNDPDATQDILLDYVLNFYNLIMGQDIKTHDQFTWYEFDTVIDTDIYTFKGAGFTNIYPPIYCIDSNSSNTVVNFFMNPNEFYLRHPVDNTNEDHSRPCDLLLYNDELLIRPKPDAVYTIKIKAYKEFQVDVTDVGTPASAIDQDYFLRYLAYGAALDYFADFGNYEDYQKATPVYNRYRSLVLKRTAIQATTQRGKPAL